MENDGRVERCELAPDLSISRVLTGLWQIADMERGGGELDPEATAAAMEPYVEAGLTTFDMADHYGSAERIVGAFIGEHGAGSVEALTKWVPEPGPIDPADVRQAVERALERLRSDRLDLLQLHAWSYSDPAYLDCLFGLEELRREGLIRHLGLTNFDSGHLELVRASGLEAVSNQVCYSLLDRRAAGAMTALCERLGIRLLAYGTLAGGLLTEHWLDRPEPGGEELATWSQMKYKRFLDVAGSWGDLQRLLGALREVAGKHGVSIANVAARWVLDQPAVGGVVIGARLGESGHVEENLRLFDFTLDAGDLSLLDEATSQLRRIPGDCGDEYRRPPYLTASGDLSHHFESLPPPWVAEVDDAGRRRVGSGTPWERLAGYSRAVRDGRRIWISGTTATHRDKVIGGSDPGCQTRFVIDKVEGALRSLGGRLEDVVRTRLFVRDVDDWEAVARAHGERFQEIRPANTLVQAPLVGDEYLVEMEAEAVVGEGGA